VNSKTAPQLLRDYAERCSEAAFAELVRRHVDFVYSAALRMVRDAHLADPTYPLEVVTGCVFARRPHPPLVATAPMLTLN
jgi:hypothetical protein